MEAAKLEAAIRGGISWDRQYVERHSEAVQPIGSAQRGIGMQKETLYLKMDRNAEISKEDVRIADLGKTYCRDKALLARVRTRKVTKLGPGEQSRKVVSVMKLIEMLQEEFPELEVENVGETETVVELVRAQRDKGVWVTAKICFVSCICFFGAAFTIIAFHNDIGIIRVFDRIYETVTGRVSDGVTVLEISYSVGLAVGIITFFNHIGGRRITKDPTPIEVEMRVYEDQVNSALAETADREGKTVDAQ